MHIHYTHIFSTQGLLCQNTRSLYYLPVLSKRCEISQQLLGKQAVLLGSAIANLIWCVVLQRTYNLNRNKQLLRFS